MSQPNEVPAEKLAPFMVYVHEKDEHLLVLETWENSEGGAPGSRTCFVVAHGLRDDTLVNDLAVSRRKMFKVVVDGKGAIRDAADKLDARIRKAEAELRALSRSEPTREQREAQLARDRKQRDWLDGQAQQCGVRLRAS
jgi:hypothetical protein